MRDHLATLLDDFRRHGRELAVIRYQGNRRRATTYGELARMAGRFAALLVKRGVEPGDRVLLWAENSAEWIAAFYGCLLRGVLAVPLDAGGTADFAARVAADVTPKLAVGDAALLSQLPPQCPRFCFEDLPTMLPEEEAGPVEGLCASTPLQILFTSGTTGDPKGIVLTHGNVLASFGPIEAASQPYLRYEKLIHPLRILHTLPLSHVFGQTMGLWIPSIYTAELHFESRLVAARLVETIRRERISVLAAVPRVLALLKTHLEATLPGLKERVAGPLGTAKGIPVWKRWWRFRDVHGALGLKFWALISGGGALPGPLEKFWNTVGLVVVQGYGMTETTALITLNHPFHVARGSIGKPLAGREVKLGPDGEVLVRGASISGATWSGGALHERSGEWLATGDLAETQPSGELRFLGRKSEVIVTAAGFNLHPEDLEAAIEQQAGVVACAVVAQQTPAGPEPCAVLAFRGSRQQAGAAIEQANARLAEFQRLRRWELWPEPDLPRTSTGKVRRKAVASWLAHAEASNGTKLKDATPSGAPQDWLLTSIAQIAGEAPPGCGNELRLTEDLHLDSLGRVQLAAAIEERLGTVPQAGTLEGMQTLGDLRRLLGASSAADTPEEATKKVLPAVADAGLGSMAAEARSASEDKTKFLYPEWPWWPPMRWMRAIFVEAALRPLVWLMAKPDVVASSEQSPVNGLESHPGDKETPPGWGTQTWGGTCPQRAEAPMLIVANHVSAYDGALVLYALPRSMRRRLAVAMSGEMLEDFRHFRNPDAGPRYGRFFLFGPLAYWLVTALFNVFPLPRLRNFQQSFTHAGKALDRGFSVLVFPEGTRSAAGELARFRPGIGLLVKQSGTAVLPLALRGLGALKARRRGWFRSGAIEVRVGQPIRFSAEETEAAITARLHAEVKRLLNE